MALKKAYTVVNGDNVSTGVELPDAYHVIKEVVIDCYEKQVSFSVVIYMEEVGCPSDKGIIGEKGFRFGDESAEDSPIGVGNCFTDHMADDVLARPGKTAFKAAYWWLKQHPLYEDSEDV